MENNRDYVDDIASIARNHSDWEYQGSDEDYRREIDTEGKIPQLRFDHIDTEALLSIEFEHDRPASAWVNLPLDRHMYDFNRNEVDEGFFHDLERAYDLFNNENPAEYMSQREPFYEVSKGSIPREYEEEEVVELLDSMSQVSREIEELHQAIFQPVRDILD